MSDGSIELFPIPFGASFEDEASFRASLIKSGILEAVLESRNLYVVVALMGFSSPEQLQAFLESEHFVVTERLGAVWKLKRTASDRGADESEFEAYLALDWENGLAVYYTNYRKTLEIDPLLIPVVSRSSCDMELFVLYPSLIQRILDSVFEEFPSARLVEFTAHTTPSTSAGTIGRKGYKRSIRYWGEDGGFSYPELHDFYGTAITSAQVELPETSTKFKLHQKGTIALCTGSASLLSHILDAYVLPEARRQRATVVKAKRQHLTIASGNRAHQVPVVFPLTIELANPLGFYEVERNLPALLKKHKFPVLSFLAEEGSLFVSASVVDRERRSSFEIRANERLIRLLPGSHTRLSTLLRFYDFVLEELDPYATLRT